MAGGPGVDRSRRMQPKIFLALLALAGILGLLIGYLDRRPTWDDTGITVGVIVLASGLLGFALPARAWAFALAIGIWVPLFEVLPSCNYGALVALVFAFVAAYLCALGRKVFD